MNKLFPIAGILCALFVSCKNNSPANNTANLIFEENAVIVPNQSPLNSKIKLQTVEFKNYSAEFNTTGVVRPVSGQIAEIAPLFDGRVTRSFVQLGQRVNAGTPLFELYSSEFSEAVKNYFQSLQTKKLTESNLLRQKDLVENGVGAAKEMEEAETDYEVALTDYENAVTGLKILNIDPNNITMGQALTVVSPIAGEVVQANMVIGQHLKSDAGPLAVIAELSRVWIVAQVKERQINSIRKDDKVEILTDADPGQLIIGNVSYIGELLDEETRSAQVLIECDNKNRKLKPGMFASVRFICSPAESIVIPSTALLQNEDEAFVFVREDEGRYTRRTVTATTANEREVLVTAGLEAGDVVVSQGAIYLMSN